jgi:hypothetical protein
VEFISVYTVYYPDMFRQVVAVVRPVWPVVVYSCPRQLATLDEAFGLPVCLFEMGFQECITLTLTEESLVLQIGGWAQGQSPNPGKIQ